MLLPVERDEAAHQIGLTAGYEAHHRLHFLQSQEGRFVAIVEDIRLLLDRHDIGMAADHPKGFHPLRLGNRKRHFSANGAERFIDGVTRRISARIDDGLGEICWDLHDSGPVRSVSYI